MGVVIAALLLCGVGICLLRRRNRKLSQDLKLSRSMVRGRPARSPQPGAPACHVMLQPLRLPHLAMLRTTPTALQFEESSLSEAAQTGRGGGGGGWRGGSSTRSLLQFAQLIWRRARGLQNPGASGELTGSGLMGSKPRTGETPRPGRGGGCTLTFRQTARPPLGCTGWLRCDGPPPD